MQWQNMGAAFRIFFEQLKSKYYFDNVVMEYIMMWIILDKLQMQTQISVELASFHPSY